MTSTSHGQEGRDVRGGGGVAWLGANYYVCYTISIQDQAQVEYMIYNIHHLLHIQPRAAQRLSVCDVISLIESDQRKISGQYGSPQHTPGAFRYRERLG